MHAHIELALTRTFRCLSSTVGQSFETPGMLIARMPDIYVVVRRSAPDYRDDTGCTHGGLTFSSSVIIAVGMTNR